MAALERLHVGGREVFAAETAGEIAEMKKEIRFLAAGYQLAANAAAAAPDESAKMVRGPSPFSSPTLRLALLLPLSVLLPLLRIVATLPPLVRGSRTHQAHHPIRHAMCARRCGRSASVAAC